MELAIEKHLDLLHKINEIQSVKVKDTDSSLLDGVEESESGPTDGDDTGLSDNDDENENKDDLGTDAEKSDAEKRKRQETDEMEYDDDSEKENNEDSESDDETTSKLDREDDPAVSGKDSGENEEGNVSDSGMKVNKSEAKQTVEVQEEINETVGEKSEGKKQKQVSQKRKKKLKRAVYVHEEDLDFEVHYALYDEPHILLAQIAQKTAKSIFVKACNNIDHCRVNDKDGPNLLQTAGVNFEVFWNLEDYLNINEVSSNDIHAMLKTYGVEAARATIIQEVNGVFKAYGIDVNMRHLSMIADFMTFDGGYRPMSRLGMGQFSTSPFGKMTFETATKFIVESASHGEADTLDCPSASVCLGKPAKVGTGIFGLMQNIGLEQPVAM